MLTSKQKQILDFLREGEKKKSEIVDRFGHWYYCNGDKHVGNLLSTMVRRNLLVRKSKGVYELNLSLQKSATNQSKEITGQQMLF